jgi:hypothetical protein
MSEHYSNIIIIAIGNADGPVDFQSIIRAIQGGSLKCSTEEILTAIVPATEKAKESKDQSSSGASKGVKTKGSILDKIKENGLPNTVPELKELREKVKSKIYNDRHSKKLTPEAERELNATIAEIEEKANHLEVED